MFISGIVTIAIANHNVPDFSPTNVKFPDFSRFSQGAATLKSTLWTCDKAESSD